MSCEFNVGSVRRHLDGIRAPGIRFDPENRVLIMMGRSVPVVSREQLEFRLRLIGYNEGMVAEIVGELFGFCVATEAPVTLPEVVESLI